MQPHQQQQQHQQFRPQMGHPMAPAPHAQMYSSSMPSWGQANLASSTPQAQVNSMWMGRQPGHPGQPRPMMQVPLMAPRSTPTAQAMGIRTAAPSSSGGYGVPGQIQSNGQKQGTQTLDPRQGMEAKASGESAMMQPNPIASQKSAQSQHSQQSLQSHHQQQPLSQQSLVPQTNVAKVLPKVEQFNTAAAAGTQKKAPPPRKTLEVRDGSGLFESYISIHPGTNKVVFKGPASDVTGVQSIVDQSCAAAGVVADEQAEYIDTDKLDSGRLVALDFDQTIVKVFLWKELNNGDENLLQYWINDGRLLERAFGGQQRVNEIRRVLTERKQQGDLLCVLSGCTRNIIIRALQFAQLSDLLPSDRVFGSDSKPYGLDKSKRLDDLLEIFNRKKACLVDDDIGHCRRAVVAGHDALWVRQQCGLEAREMKRLIDSEWDSKADLGLKA